LNIMIEDRWGFTPLKYATEEVKKVIMSKFKVNKYKYKKRERSRNKNYK
jgi:hypothetical protein